MDRRRHVYGWLGLCVCALAVGRGSAQERLVIGSGPFPLEQLPDHVRERARLVVEHPTLTSYGPVEAFNCQPAMYFWLLDHPDLAVRVWKLLGAHCADVMDQGGG